MLKHKKILTIVALIILVIAMIHLIVFIFLNVSGKALLKSYIKKNFSTEAEISSVSFRFPFTVVVKGFKCNDVEFSRADVSLGIFNPFSSHISLSRVYIDNLNLRLKIEKDKVSIAPVFGKKTVSAKLQVKESEAVAEKINTSGQSLQVKPKPICVTIGKLFVNNASVQISDLTKENPVVFDLKKINIILKHFIYPQLPKFYVEMNASLEKGDIRSDNLIKIKGWVDYAHRNMDLQFNINNIDYIMFSEYYPPFWKPDNLGVEEAKLSLNTNTSSHNNDLTIEAVLLLDNIKFSENTQNSSNVNTLKTMIAIFKGDNDKPTLPIKLKTKMDSFDIDFASLQSEFQGKLKLNIGAIVMNIIGKTKKGVAETTDKAKDVTVDKAVDTIKGVVDDISNIVKKPEIQQQEETIKQSQEESEQNNVQADNASENSHTNVQSDVSAQNPVVDTESSNTLQ